MRPLMEYIRDFGNLTFEEKPFCDMDNIALCEAFYMDIERAAPNHFEDEPMPFDEMARKMFELNGNKNVPMGLILDKSVSEVVMAMGKTKRFAEVKVTACHAVYSVDPPIQFDAGTFILPDGTKVITYRGTDDTLVGWYEDTMIMTNKKMPSNDLAAEYLTEADEKFKDGGFIVTGHSKGGNLALYAALNCSQSARDRIVTLYNNDGPGFADYDYLESKAYKELLPRYKHFMPSNGFFGLMLAYDNDFETIKSSRLLPPLAHDLTSWKHKDGELMVTDGLSPMGKINDRAFNPIFMNINEEQGEVFGKVAYTVLQGTGQKGLLDVAKNAPAALSGAAQAWNSIDDETKESFKEIFKGSKDVVILAIRTVREETMPVFSQRVNNVVRMFTDLRHKEFVKVRIKATA